MRKARNPPVRGTVFTNVRIPNSRDGGFHPHAVSVLVPTGAGNRAVVLLHGGGGSGGQIAQDWRVSASSSISYENTNWALLAKFKTIVAVVDGQACVGNVTVENPKGIDTRNANNPNGIRTWTNHDMNSSADDVQMLEDLAQWLLDELGSTHRHLFGYSEGGIMAKRMWYEAPGAFSSFVTVAGPANSYFKGRPTPRTVQPMLCLNGELDENLNGPALVGPHFTDDTWTQGKSTLSKAMVSYPKLSQRRGEWVQFGIACAASGKAAPAYDKTKVDSVSVGTRRTWTSGAMQLQLFSSCSHGFIDYQAATGNGMFDLAMGWALSMESTSPLRNGA